MNKQTLTYQLGIVTVNDHNHLHIVVGPFLALLSRNRH